MRVKLSILFILTSFVLASEYNELCDKLLEKFSHVYGISKGDIELQIYNSNYKNKFYNDKGYEVRLNGMYNRLGLTTVWLLYKDSKGIIKEKIPITLRVSAFFDVLIAKENISPGETIDNEKIEIRRLKIERGNLDFFRLKDLPEISGMVAKRFIRKGEIIRDHMIKEKPFVSRGSRVKVKLESKNFDVMTEGVLKEDGYLNRRVRVACEPAGKILTGVLKEKELVVVELQ
ncbi:MAG: flagellar basal body P-ring formation protein FlgA [Candidatus Marinimicrobia bacterium]|nr:flagellar basal body P-ring formation protein FlgA [Candidatus Neomarinimicrobiota bacterium]